jgi:DNA-3-methyladenine glycosylase II
MTDTTALEPGRDRGHRSTSALRVVPAEAVRHLRAADPVMSRIVESIGELEFRQDGDLWRAIVGSIAGQQLSVAAAGTIRERIAALGAEGFPSPREISTLSEEVLRGCGLSRAKVLSVRGVAMAWLEGDIDPARLLEQSDEEVIESLVRLRGVGRWTAEMVLIFSLGRSDVLAVDDLGIRSAVQRAYGLAERPVRAELLRIGEPWRPYRSFASLCLWRSLKGLA